MKWLVIFAACLIACCLLSFYFGFIDRRSEFERLVYQCDPALVSEYVDHAQARGEVPSLAQMMAVFEGPCSSSVKLEMLREFEGKAELLSQFDEFGTTPLNAAVGHCDATVVEYFLNLGADPNLQNPYSGETPLLLACRLGDLEEVQLLVSRGARVDLGDNSERYPIHPASGTSYKMMQAILQANRAEATRPEEYGVTPIFFVLMSGASESEMIRRVELLVQYGANLSTPISLPEPLPDSRVLGLGPRRRFEPVDGETGYEFAARVLGHELKVEVNSDSGEAKSED